MRNTKNYLSRYTISLKRNMKDGAQDDDREHACGYHGAQGRDEASV
ncbi:hypothetical protein BBSC_1431 [Bifidobacterium scardovii JCM 12489 = DSM 13734]|nr:hypothetical protein BBSC_1431 [Bifidobacterium scardovii JCM 12489 = DSM 13734]